MDAKELVFKMAKAFAEDGYCPEDLAECGLEPGVTECGADDSCEDCWVKAVNKVL